ncbi:MAG: formyltetrahydrofolate deformylase [Planctomycetes bacterium]|nr:formyltetrahydrofolate deformylase [Planctomycetota bacterium]
MPPSAPPTARLLIACPDARGIVATVAGFVAEHRGNLLESEQHTDTEHGEFFMRAEFEVAGCDLTRGNFADVWGPVAERLGMNWRVYWSEDVKRVAIMVSKAAHCLHDLIWRWEAGELNVEIAAVISNHDTLRRAAEHAGLPFHHCPIEPGRKTLQEQQVRAILNDARCDFVVLARYMQILSPEFLAGYEQRVINIHHSFLPAFAGGDPYRQAYDRGVKIIGATSHYVTEVLDAGPIIAQEVVDVSHRHTVADLRRKGRDLERMVLARAVRAHVEDRILASNGKTVVFS